MFISGISHMQLFLIDNHELSSVPIANKRAWAKSDVGVAAHVQSQTGHCTTRFQSVSFGHISFLQKLLPVRLPDPKKTLLPSRILLFFESQLKIWKLSQPRVPRPVTILQLHNHLQTGFFSPSLLPSELSLRTFSCRHPTLQA